MPNTDIEHIQNQSIKRTVDIHNIKPLSEVEKNTEIFIPTIQYGKEGTSINKTIVDECNSVAKKVLKYLRAPVKKLSFLHHPLTLVDSNAVNENNLNTFPRTEFGEKNMDIPVIIYSSSPVYDAEGNLVIAMFSPDNSVIFISTNEIKRQFSEEASEDITKPGDLMLKKNILEQPEIMSGIAMIEEITHFVQVKHWGEKSEKGTNSVQNIKEHDADPIEAEARIIKNQLIKLIYPQYIEKEF